MDYKKQLYSITRRIICLSILAISFISCDDLPIDTQGELASEEFFKSASDIEIATLGVYSVLNDKLFANSERYAFLWAADDRTAATGSNKTFFLEYDQMTPLNTNTWTNLTWDALWQLIGAANTFFDNEPKMRELVAGTSQEADLDRNLGEVHFIRGMMYFELVQAFGTVPLITSQEDLTGEESLASFEDIYALIIDDLTFAKNHLEPTPVNGIYRATSWQASALLAKVYLTSAGFPLKKEANYALAAAEAKNIIDNGPFNLEPLLSGIMGTQASALSENGNTEAIIAIPALQSLDGWNAGNYQAEVIAFGDKWVERAFYENFPDGYRKDFTFDDVNGQIQYSKEKFGEQDNSSVNKDINYLRYAELLLIFAEAQIRATGNNADASALEALNAVKERAGLTPVVSATWEDIFWEKAWELAGEYDRWYDIIRTETLDEVNALRDPYDNNLTPLGNDLTEANPWALIPAEDIAANPNLIK